MMKMNKIFLALAVLSLLASPLGAVMNDAFGLDYVQQPGVRLLTEVTDEPAWFWMIWFAGAGNISDITISNTLQGGYFKRHPVDEHEFRGQLYTHNGYGDNFEFPAGSEQFYGWAFGIWVGSNYPAQIGGGGSGRKPNVSKCAFNSDLGAMAAPEMSSAGTMQDISQLGMYFSDMTIPEISGFEGVGDFLFAQGGATPLEYQTLWPFTDTMINEKRRAIDMPEVDPENGDIISKQDTYACGGDWIPAKDAAAIWIRQLGPYDVWGQGIRIEQRTYSWDYDYNKDYVYFNYKIRNMNDFTLDSVYLSWFMDNDIGSGGASAGDDGSWDDLIGFDQELNMGYTYDAGGSESGWITAAGYIGCIFLETPEDIGLTGFETWQNGFEIDRDGTDSLKYAYMTSTDFVTWENPNDVRMLMNCGPIDELAPGEEVEITIAVACAYSLDELREKAEAARIQFENGYFGYSPPPNPALSVVAGDSVVYLNWSSDPEDYVDPMSGEKTFEGYRVYKSLSGISGTWDLLAEYDLQGSYNPDTVVTEHTVGPTKSTIEFVGFHSLPLLRGDKSAIGYSDNTYTITFEDTMYYRVYDVGNQELLTYNNNALEEGGYCVLTSRNGTPEELDAAEKAEGEVTFSGSDGTEIPEGTVVATDVDDPIFGYVEFKTTEDGSIGSEGSLTLDVEAVLAGASGNVYAGAVTTLVDDTISGVTSVTNANAIKDGKDGQTQYPYESGDIIFIDGAQVVIEDGDPAQAEQGDILEPRAGEHFTVKTFSEEQLGGQEGIRHFYIDDEVKNGQIYYYSVTSYSRAQPTEDVGSLEGGLSGKSYWAVPRSNPMGWQEAVTTPAERISGSGTALVEVEVVSPEEVTGDTYQVGFKEDPETETIRLAYFEDETADSLILDDFRYRSGEFSGPVLDGVFIRVAGVSMDTLDTEELIDSLKTEWLEKDTANDPTDMDFQVEWTGNTAGEPITVLKDYLVEIVEHNTDRAGRDCHIAVSLYDDPSQEVDIFWADPETALIKNGSSFQIYDEGVTKLTVYFIDTVFVVDTSVIDNDTIIDTTRKAITPKPGEKFLIKTLPSTTPQDIFRYTTGTSLVDADDTTRTLKDIRVVPNPYYIRAPWDLSQYTRRVMFQYLPTNCTIRVFNTAGLLIRTIEHEGEGEEGLLDGNAGSEPWDLLTDEGLDCTSGLYIWQVETEDGDKAWGKFAIVR
ncbi:hypothetical protein GF359_03575 [candidate division WOR-3 bacterium]|uniref:Baseplate protein J-like barrel domain-containing protein n=1 Tax=candidate division WOR-3 bacterium TaxID=2052148 RepID=A0A9D5QDQ0_UNCW3|nr:hypothetical protein [candidate division WOR-3 bacterium]MBD3364275.1 hypothetical protein [candidate division WOR-3 bacterium]